MIIVASFLSFGVGSKPNPLLPSQRSVTIMLSLSSLSALCALAVAALAVDPAPPTLTYLFSVNLTFAEPISIGSVPYGTRDLLTISGGNAVGPKISGRNCDPFKRMLCR